MTDDWRNRGGMVQAGLVLSPMNMNIEHVFELIEVKSKLGIQTPYGIKDKIQLIWKEVGVEKEAHRVWTEFNESYAEKSGLVGFISRASPKPVMPGITLKLGDYLELGMQIRTLVQARIDKKTGLPNGYYDFIPASIKPAGSIALPKEFCFSCKETGGELPEAPLKFYCMEEMCSTSNKNCLFVQHGGKRP